MSIALFLTYSATPCRSIAPSRSADHGNLHSATVTRQRSAAEHGIGDLREAGPRMFAMGCYPALRNPANHLSGDWNPVTAFQHLAAFSTVTGWVRNWRVNYYVAPIPDLTTQLAQMQKTN
jgi:hypothetical protein